MERGLLGGFHRDRGGAVQAGGILQAFQAKHRINFGQGRVHLRGLAGNHGPGFGTLARADYRNVRLDDSGFFRGDQFDGMPEIIFVVEVDRGDDRDLG